MAEPTDTESVARSYFERLINSHDLSFADQLFDASIVFTDPARLGGPARGLDAVKGFFTTFFTAFPDVNFQIDDFFTQNGKAAIRFTWTGTHQARFLDIDITQRHVTVPGIDIFHIANGKITEVEVAFDRLELIEQLGGISHPL